MTHYDTNSQTPVTRCQYPKDMLYLKRGINTITG